VRTIKLFILMVLIVAPGFFLLQGAETGKQKRVQALPIEEPIKIDGLLKEKAWQREGSSGFIQSEPVDGAPATEKTTVWVAYHKNALYIAARLYDSEPDKIIARLGRRDALVNSDWFFFSIDTYYDRRTGYEFGVNPAGSIMDMTIYNDENYDNTWDGVWESKTHIDDKGWTVEMRIPFDQLRFKKKNQQVWGVHFQRIIKRKNEKVNFVRMPRDESGYVSRFAKLVGITGVKPGRFIEVLPYTVGKAAFSPEVEENPFETGEEYIVNAGLDLKMGLKSNLTLDLTVNPDFGQVEVDPAVINLTAAEIYYQEKRLFFIEGADIFRFGRGGANRFVDAGWDPPGFFYSRRIGRPPQGFIPTPGFVQYPDWATILLAAKLTGKIGNNWDIGLINAFTQREYAQIHLEGSRSREEVEPFSYYGVFRAQKQFNRGKQGLGIIATAVLRDLQEESLENLLPRDAFSLGIDGWTFPDKNRTWAVTGWLGATHVSGTKAAIRNLQHAYPHYFQRPDVTHVKLNENATSMSGWAGRFTINKQRGNFMFNAGIGAVSPGFDSSDMGFQQIGDRICSHLMMGYRWFKQGKIFRDGEVSLLVRKNYDFGGNPIGEQGIILSANVRFLNYWGSQFNFSINSDSWGNEETRGGPLVRILPSKWGQFFIYSDNRKPFFLTLGGMFLDVESGTYYRSVFSGLTWNPGKNFRISIEPEYSVFNEMAQWVTNVRDEWMTETYGTRHVFAELDQKMVSCSIRLNWSLTPKLSLQAYIQPFIAVGAYKRFKELARPQSYDFNVFGQGNSTISYYPGYNAYLVDPDGPGQIPYFYFGNPDFNYKSLRGTIVLRWEYRSGSTLYFVWTQNRQDFSNPGDFRFGRDFSDLLKARGDNIFMLKFTYQFKL
jgi:hypothetical protein